MALCVAAVLLLLSQPGTAASAGLSLKPLSFDVEARVLWLRLQASQPLLPLSLVMSLSSGEESAVPAGCSFAAAQPFALDFGTGNSSDAVSLQTCGFDAQPVWSDVRATGYMKVPTALTGLIAFEQYKCAVLVSLLSDVCVVCPCPLLSFFKPLPPQPPPPPTSVLAPPPPYVPPDLSPSPEPNIIYSSLALCREQIDRPDDVPPDTIFYAGETLCIDQTILGLPAGAALVNHTVLVNGTLVTEASGTQVGLLYLSNTTAVVRFHYTLTTPYTIVMESISVFLLMDNVTLSVGRDDLASAAAVFAPALRLIGQGGGGVRLPVQPQFFAVVGQLRLRAAMRPPAGGVPWSSW